MTTLFTYFTPIILLIIMFHNDDEERCDFTTH